MNAEQATTILEFLLPSIEREHQTTAKVLAAVPGNQSGYQPDARSMTADQLAWHIASSEQYFMSGVAEGGFAAGGDRPASVKTVDDIVAWYREQSAANHARLRQLTGEQLVQMISFHGVMSLPAVNYLQLMLNHSVHHRGQLSAYLRPMGAKVPAIYGMSADENPFEAAAAATQA
jgi:uncharacterized damage-inducible protein DinB